MVSHHKLYFNVKGVNFYIFTRTPGGLSLVERNPDRWSLGWNIWCTPDFKFRIHLIEPPYI